MIGYIGIVNGYSRQRRTSYDRLFLSNSWATRLGALKMDDLEVTDLKWRLLTLFTV